MTIEDFYKKYANTPLDNRIKDTEFGTLNTVYEMIEDFKGNISFQLDKAEAIFKELEN